MKRILSLILAISMIITMTTLCASAQNDYSASGIADNITVDNRSNASTITEENDGDFGTALKISVPNTGSQNVFFELPEAITSGVAEVSFDVRLQDWTKNVVFYAGGAATGAATNPKMAKMYYYYGNMYGMGLEDGSFANTKMRESYVTCRFIINLDTKERKSYAGDGVKTYDASYTNFYETSSVKRLAVNFNTTDKSGTYDENKENNVLWIKNVSVKPYALSAATDIENGEIGISDGINVSFNEPVSADSVTPENFILSDNSGNIVSSTLTPSEDYKTVTVKPEADLAYNEAYTLTVKNSVTSAYANAMNADYIKSFTTKKAENKVVLNETFDSETDGCLTLAYGDKKEIMLSETLTGERALISYDMKIDPGYIGYVWLTRSIVDIQKSVRESLLWMEYNRIMVNTSGLDNYFASVSRFSDFKNIKIIMNLKTKKIEAVYYDGAKMTNGYNEDITYSTLEGLSFWNKSVNEKSANETYSPDKKIYFDNVKVMTLNANTIMGTSILNGAENVSVSSSVDFSFANEITDNLADYFTVSEGETVLDSSKYTLTLSEDKKTVIVKVNGAMQFGTAYTVTAKAGFGGMTSPYSIAFKTAESVALGIASSEIKNGETSAILQKWFHFTLNAPINTEYFNEKSSITDAGRKLITVKENGTEITAFDVLIFSNNDKMLQLYINNPKAGASYSVTISPEIASLPADGSAVRGDNIVINYTYIKNPVTYEKVENTDGTETINFTVNGIGDASRNTYMEGYNLIVGVYEGNKLISTEIFTEPYNFIKNSKYSNVKSVTYTPADGITVKAMLTRGLEFMTPYMEAVTVE